MLSPWISGRKKVEDTLQCEWEHPKICPKLFKHGFHPERGCKGKKAGCEDFHPVICGELLKGECQEINCQRGFHLRSLVRKPKKRDQTPEVESSPHVAEVRHEPQSLVQPQNVTNQYIGPPPQTGSSIASYSSVVSGPPPCSIVQLVPAQLFL